MNRRPERDADALLFLSGTLRRAELVNMPTVTAITVLTSALQELAELRWQAIAPTHVLN
jgi:hypothetical protein